MSVIDLIVLAVFGLLIGMVYAYLGYELVNVLTDDPKWKPWEQCLLWMFWPVLLPLLVVAVITLFLAAMLVSVFFAFVTCYDIIKKTIKKLSR